MVASTIANAGRKSLRQFAREIDLPSMHSSLFARWSEARRKLSELAWDLHSANAYAHYRATHPQAGAPHVERTGLYDQGRLNAEDTEALHRLFHECPVKPYSVDEFHEGYSFDPTGSLESYNTYRTMTPAFETKLGEALQKIAPQVEEICGHHFRIVSSHLWSLNPGPRRYQYHLDWWPVALKKLFILPGGLDEHKGSTAFRLKSGEEVVAEGPPGTWIVFENSGVEHKGVESSTVLRPTIAISIAPSFRTDLRLLDAGTNSGYPWFPVEMPSEGAAYRDPEYFRRENLDLRTLKRVIELAGLEVTLTDDGMVQMPAAAHAEPPPAAHAEPPPAAQGPAQPDGFATAVRRKLGGIRRRLLSR